MNFLRRFTPFPTIITLLFTTFAVLSWLSAEDLIHVVGRGETIYSISRLYGVTADDLMKANNITDPSKLQAGGRLKVPSAAASITSAATQTASSSATSVSDYRVVRGDTLYSIARNNGMVLQALLDLNRFSSGHVLKVGDVIKVSAVGGGDKKNDSPGARSSLYTLRWPIAPKEIAYMTGQMGVVVEGEYAELVKSLTQGNVISAGPWRKFGRVVIVESAENHFYMYGGLEILSVSVGDRITPGTEVGKLGINSVSEKPQLFFMVFRDDTPIDPASAPRAGTSAKI